MTMRAVCELGKTFRGAAPFAGALEMKELTFANAAGEHIKKSPIYDYEMMNNYSYYKFKKSVTE
jgi:hypothetical protein